MDQTEPETKTDDSEFTAEDTKGCLGFIAWVAGVGFVAHQLIPYLVHRF